MAIGIKRKDVRTAEESANPLGEASRQIVRQLELFARAAALLSITREAQANQAAPGFGASASVA
jgi:hypothetical protein